VRDGYVIVPQHIHKIPTKTIARAIDSSQALIEAMAQFDCQTALLRYGEREPELGLVHRTPDDGKDIKYFLHLAHDLRFLIKTVPELEIKLRPHRHHIAVLEALYYDVYFFLNVVLLHAKLEVLALRQLTPDLIERFNKSFTESLPDSTSTLRGLWYPASQAHQGARGHFDRSFITAHLGDRGGSLLGHREMGLGQAFDISPKFGQILLFWGVKALMLSQGTLMPLWHSATTRPDEDRQALVLFGHVEIPHLVDDALVGYQEFCRAQGIDNAQEFYTQRMQP
jgi:hypothetical protein